MTKKVVEEQQTLKHESYELRYTVKKTATTCGTIMRRCPLKGGKVGTIMRRCPLKGGKVGTIMRHCPLKGGKVGTIM